MIKTKELLSITTAIVMTPFISSGLATISKAISSNSKLSYGLTGKWNIVKVNEENSNIKRVEVDESKREIRFYNYESQDLKLDNINLQAFFKKSDMENKSSTLQEKQYVLKKLFKNSKELAKKNAPPCGDWIFGEKTQNKHG